jgi:hypothetical protein
MARAGATDAAPATCDLQPASARLGPDCAQSTEKLWKRSRLASRRLPYPAAVPACLTPSWPAWPLRRLTDCGLSAVFSFATLDHRLLQGRSPLKNPTSNRAICHHHTCSIGAMLQSQAPWQSVTVELHQHIVHVRQSVLSFVILAVPQRLARNARALAVQSYPGRGALQSWIQVFSDAARAPVDPSGIKQRQYLQRHWGAILPALANMHASYAA